MLPRAQGHPKLARFKFGSNGENPGLLGSESSFATLLPSDPSPGLPTAIKQGGARNQKGGLRSVSFCCSAPTSAAGHLTSRMLLEARVDGGSGHSYSLEPSVQSEATPENAARERSRVRTLRQAFLALQAALPAVPPDTKLSKLDVLVLATSYIAHLTRTLGHELPSPAWPPFLRGLRHLHPLKVCHRPRDMAEEILMPRTLRKGGVKGGRTLD